MINEMDFLAVGMQGLQVAVKASQDLFLEILQMIAEILERSQKYALEQGARAEIHDRTQELHRQMESAERARQEIGKYDIRDGVVYGYSGDNANLTIPGYRDGYPVTKVGKEAFADSAFLETLYLDRYNRTDTIGPRSFARCDKLALADLSELKKLEGGAFQDCTSLTTVRIPNARFLGSGAFRNCSSLNQVTLSPDLRAIGREAFAGCSSLLSLELPAGLKRIGPGAFRGCSALTELTIPEGCQPEPGALYGTSLVTLHLPQGMEADPKWFQPPEVALNVPEVDGAVRSRILKKKPVCLVLRNITEIPDCALSGCSSLETVELPAGLTRIGNDAFSGCRNLKEIRVPEGTKEIGAGAFRNCESLQKVWIPEGCELSPEAFSGHHPWLRLMVPVGMDVDRSKFPDLTITQYVPEEQPKPIPGRVIRSECFAGREDLRSVELTEAHAVEPYAFTHCENLTSVRLPGSLSRIGSGAFASCRNLKEITLPPSIHEVEIGAFSDCPALEVIRVPEGKDLQELGLPADLPVRRYDPLRENRTSEPSLSGPMVVHDLPTGRDVTSRDTVTPGGKPSAQMLGLAHRIGLSPDEIRGASALDLAMKLTPLVQEQHRETYQKLGSRYWEPPTEAQISWAKDRKIRDPETYTRGELSDLLKIRGGGERPDSGRPERKDPYRSLSPSGIER